MKPVVSVLLPIRAGENKEYVKQAINSIKCQTFKMFELLIGNDTRGQGVTQTLITLASRAQGKYLARQDSDDLSDPLRLAWQVEYLQHHRETQVVGSWATLIDGKGRDIGF